MIKVNIFSVLTVFFVQAFVYAQESSQIAVEKTTQGPLYWTNNWAPENLKHSIGVETASASLGVLGTTVMAYSYWWSQKWGFEALVGFAKSSDTAQSSVDTNVNVINNSQTITTAFTGVENPLQITAGAVIKNRVYQSSWLQVYWGGLAAVKYTGDVSYQSGSSTTTVPDLASPNDFTVTESNLGANQVSRELEYLIGPRIGTEIYLKWFPNLALGFATGVTYSIGGEQRTQTNTATRSYNVVSGVPQDPTTSNSSSNTVVTRRPPGTINTFGFGGTSFSFTGVWTVKYLW